MRAEATAVKQSGARKTMESDLSLEFLRVVEQAAIASATSFALGAVVFDLTAPADPSAPLPNLRKDLHTAIELAKTLGIDVPVATEASRVADAGTATGHDDQRL